MCDAHKGMMLTPPQKNVKTESSLTKLLNSTRNYRKGFHTRKLLHQGIM